MEYEKSKYCNLFLDAPKSTYRNSDIENLKTPNLQNLHSDSLMRSLRSPEDVHADSLMRSLRSPQEIHANSLMRSLRSNLDVHDNSMMRSLYSPMDFHSSNLIRYLQSKDMSGYKPLQTTNDEQRYKFPTFYDTLTLRYL